MDAILAYEPKRADDYYGIVGCDELSSTEQIIAEYKTKALACHPDKNSSPEAAERFATLQRAKEVLCDPKSREDYDKWRHSGLAMPYDEWRARKDCIHTSLHWAMKTKKEPALEAGPTDCRTQTLLDSKDDAWTGPNWDRDDECDTLRQFRNYEI